MIIDLYAILDALVPVIFFAFMIYVPLNHALKSRAKIRDAAFKEGFLQGSSEDK